MLWATKGAHRMPWQEQNRVSLRAEVVAHVARGAGRLRPDRQAVVGAGVRTALYLVTVTANRTTPGVAAHYAALTRTKPAKVALVACARKLLTVLNAMLRDGVPWSATRLGATSA
jgi:transposase